MEYIIAKVKEGDVVFKHNVVGANLLTDQPQWCVYSQDKSWVICAAPSFDEAVERFRERLAYNAIDYIFALRIERNILEWYRNRAQALENAISTSRECDHLWFHNLI